MSAVLQYENITKQYGRFMRAAVVALDDFSLSIERGEIFGFLGPNGAGKTTAIHLAVGFMRATRGSGTLLGNRFGHAPTRRRVGFLAENVALYHRPAAKLLRFYGGLNGLRDPRLARAVRDVLETLELADLAQRNIGKLSRGMLQRVGLAQALVNDPELLILDEPTSALDPLGRLAVRELLLRARNAGKTVFLSSHMLSEIELICDRVGILHRGQMARVGRTSELLESSEQCEVVARGVPASSFLQAAAENGLVRFTVACSEQRETIERVWSLGGEVVRVNPVKRSLEDIFVELTGKELAINGQS
ncbi:MAG: ABC transporter ATP-binding protein [Acidobacteriia bacterium]|nr:ABC transporter ATP-binding protein [Terriglobia bacterium]